MIGSLFPVCEILSWPARQRQALAGGSLPLQNDNLLHVTCFELMKYKNIIYICIAIIIAAFVLYRFVGNTPQSNKAQTLPQEQNTLSKQTNSEGSVTITVTPKNLSQPTFEIVLDTHKGNLNQDLTKNTILIDDQGNRQKPVGWEGDPLGGHHRKGILLFNSFQEKSKLVTLKIQNVGQVQERSFTWAIK